jgi:small subunit ribosomal protein S20
MKRVRSSRRKGAYNHIVRSTAKTYVTKARRLIADQQFDEAQAVIQDAISALDKAAQKGVIHKNNAARRKSRLVKLYNQAKKEA